MKMLYKQFKPYIWVNGILIFFYILVYAVITDNAAILITFGIVLYLVVINGAVWVFEEFIKAFRGEDEDVIT